MIVFEAIEPVFAVTLLSGLLLVAQVLCLVDDEHEQLLGLVDESGEVVLVRWTVRGRK